VFALFTWAGAIAIAMPIQGSLAEDLISQEGGGVVNVEGMIASQPIR
jgi:hypothetical protein